ncbi:MAG: T9SS type A sorting domain-containing protein [Acidobacteriota bacterium]
MKSIWYDLLLGFLFGALLIAARPVKAQIVGDTMTVQWQDQSSKLPIQNALRSAILGDTVSGGARANANRVYKLLKNGVYWEADRIENKNFTLRIVGEYVSPNGTDYPPEIQMMDLRADGTSGDTRLITGVDNMTLKNLYISGRTNAQGVQTSYQPIQVDASNKTFVIDNCILEYSNFALVAFTGTGNDITFTNNKFRNLVGQPSTQQWEGRGISIWADQKRVVVENNTFFNVGMTAFQLEGGSAKYLRINHNTFVNMGRAVNTGNWFQEAYIANNLIVNGWWHGEGYADMTNTGRDPRNSHNGLFTIGALPSIYGPEQGRRIVITKEYAYLDPKFTTLYGDTIHRAWFIDPVTKLDFLALYPNMVVKDTVWLTAVPAGLKYPTSDADWLKPLSTATGASMIDSMWSNITLLRAGRTPATRYFYKPLANPADVIWPLPENFSYTQANLLTAGTDQLPIGDLNWFPAQKATWLSNFDKNIKDLEALGGPVTVFTVDSTVEAEKSTLGGTASVSSFSGFSYYYMEGGGFIQWDFDLPAGGVYGMNVWSHMRSQDMRGQHFFINGAEIHDVIGWGELEFTSKQRTSDPKRGVGINLDNNKWNWYFFPKDSILAADQSKFVFVTGKNTIKITPSWGYQEFGGIDLIKDGVTPPLGQTVTGANLIKALRAPDATTAIVTPKGEGAPWVPSLFKSVSMGTNGSVAASMSVKSAGSYHLRVFYQNPGSAAQTLTVKEGTTTLATMSLKGKTDSTGLDMMSDKFALSAGSHTITVSGGNVNIDYLQLIKEQVITGVDNGQAPYTYELAQNYPNPFNPATTIRFSLAKPSRVNLAIYNVLGQKVAVLVNQPLMEAGPHEAGFNAAKYASGVYFYRLEAGSFVSVKKMMLLK